jgi:predicted double-glycine peptidase
MDKREGVLMTDLNTTEGNGTNPNDIVRVAQELGFNATMRSELTIEDLASSVKNGVPVIIVAQAWTDDQGTNFTWADDWQDGHYMVVIGVDSTYVYLEDPAILGSRGMIPVDEFNARWHDFLGTALDAPDVTILQHMGIFITGSSHGQYPGFIPVA